MKKWQKFDPELETKILAALGKGHQKPGKIQEALGLADYVEISGLPDSSTSIIGECLQDMKARGLIVLGPKGRWMLATSQTLTVEIPISRAAELRSFLESIGGRAL